jgi:predicted permease
MDTLLQDVAYALRGLRKNLAFTLVAVLTLGLGIGANTAIFSVVNGVVLKPLEYSEPSRLVMITSQFPSLGFDKFWVSPPEYVELQEWNRSFEVIGAYRLGNASVGTEDAPLRVTSAIATAEFFEALAVAPLYGRTYTREEDAPGGDPVVVLSRDLWERAYGGDPGLVGTSILVDGASRTVVGVMPEGFDIEDAGVELWTPVQLDPATFPERRGNHFLYLVGRLNPGVGLEQARQDVDAMLVRWEEELPDTHTPSREFHRMVLTDLQEEVVGDVRPALLILLSAVGFVLLIAVANVGNLLLARAESRQKEIAVRTALGAGQARLVRQFLTESVALGLLGGVVGLGVAAVGLRVLTALGPGTLPRMAEISLSGTVLAFTLGISVLTGLLFGVAPLGHVGTQGAMRALREGSGRTSGKGRRRVRGTLVVAEVALAVVLVIGSGLMIRSFGELRGVDPGFDVENALTFQLFLPPQGYPTPLDQQRFLGDLQQSLRAIPGVLGTTAMSGLPPLRDVNANDMKFEGLERTADGPAHNVDYWQFVSPEYFSTMGIELVAGRAFGLQDDGASEPVAIVNERLVQVFYPDLYAQSPELVLGRRLGPGGDDSPYLTIVGVARDVKQGGIGSQTGTEVYFYAPQVAAALGYGIRQVHVMVRSDRPPLAMAAAVRDAVWALDPSLPIADLQTLEEHVSSTLARDRFLTLLLTVFALVALTLAAVGTYGVISYSVAERRREIGIRMAMGAEASSVLRMVVVSGGRLALAGLTLGVIGALALTKVMSSLLYGVSATDPAAFIMAPGVLALVALAACLIPARRATRVDPALVLRDE